MSDSLGTRLRQRREEQGIALPTIAQDTKIKLALLEALERDDVTHWPSGIFRRAYVRAYAQAIGLSPDAILREFMDTYPDPEEVLAAAIAAQAATRSETAGPARLRQLMGSALGSLSRLRRPPAVNEPAMPIPIPPDPVVVIHDPVPAAPAVPEHTVMECAAVAVATLETTAAEAVVTEPPPTPAEIAVAVPPAPPAMPPPDPDYEALARLCTAFARIDTVDEAEALLKEAARVLDATGVILWIADELARELRATLSSGYSQTVLAQFPIVSADADNITAAAYRTAQPCAIGGDEDESGALALPLPAPGGCAGVLALELEHGREELPSVRAAATILAAVIGQLLGVRVSYPEVEAPVPVAPTSAAFRVVARR